ncbi:MAG: gliding motility-associated C-terminal domain-containing protein, partial [Bacteroidales bacterium]|nr:gliding motility-associated C-terminal domain-containing protein [Bacteroidales bacterium]
VTVTVSAPSVAPTSLTATPSSICSGSSTITVNGGSLGTGAVWQLYTGSCGGTLVGSNSTGSFSVSPTSTTTYYIRASGTCNTTSCQSVTVTVSAPSVAPTSLTATPSSICSGSSTITVNGGSLGTGAVWQLYTGSCGGTLVGSNSTGSFSVSPTSTTTYYIRASGTCNTTSCQSVTVTVSAPSVAPTSLTATPSSICSGSSTITVNGGSLGTGAVWQLYTGSCGGTLVGSNSTGTFSVSPTSTTTYYIRASGTCNTTSCQSVTVTVSAPSVAPTSLTATPSSICSGSSTITVNGGSLGTGAVWQLYTGSCGGTLVGSNSTGSFSVSPTSTTTYYIRASGTCNTTSCQSVTVTVSAPSVAPTSLTATPSSICSGSSTITVNGGSLGTGAVWQLYTGSCGGTLVGSNSTGSFSVSPTSTTTYYIRASGTCNTTSCQSVTVTVNTASVAPTSLTANPTTICPGNNATISVNGGSLGSGAVWQMYSGSCGGTLISSNSTGSFSVSPTSATTYYIRASGDCNTTSCQSVTVNVNTNSVNPTSLNASPAVLCSGGNSLITVNGGTLGTGGSWQLFTGGCGGTLIGSNTTGSFTVIPTSTTTYYLQGSGTCNTTSCVSTSVTISSISTAPTSVAASPATICSGNTTTLTVNGGSLGAGAVWELFEGSCGTTLLASNSTGIFTVTPSVTTTYFIRANGSCNTTGCTSVTVNVNQSSTTPLSLTATPSNLCAGTSSTLSVNGGSLGAGATWQLYEGSCGGSPISTNTTGNFTVTPSTTTNYYILATGNCNTTLCVNTSVTVNSTSVAPSSITTSPSSICAGSTSTLTLNGGLLGAGASWQLFSGSCSGVYIGSNTTGVFSVSPTQTTTYYIQATGLCNTTSCVPATITVSDTSVVPTSITANPALICTGNNTTLTVNGGALGSNASWNLYESSCGGTLLSSNITGVFSVSPQSTTTYYVQAVGLCNTTPCANVTVVIGSNSIAPNSLMITPSPLCEDSTATITVVGGSLGSNAVWELFTGSCGGTPIASNTTGIFSTNPSVSTTYFVQGTGECNTTNCVSSTLTVNPIPDNASIILGPASVCEGATNVTYTVTPINGAVNYVWTLPNGFTGSSNSNIITLNVPTGAVSGSISVYGSNNCGDGGSSTLFINVNPLPVVNLSAFNSFCANDLAFNLSGGTPIGGSYTGLNVSNGMFNPQTAGAGTHIVTYTYTDNNGCSNTATNTVIVHALPLVTLDSINNICENVSSVSLIGGQPAGGTYSGNNVVAGVLYPSGAGIEDVYYSYTNTNGCTDTAHAAVLIANEVTLSSNMVSNTVYTGMNTEITFTAIPAGQGTYNFYVNNALTQSSISNQFISSTWNQNTIVTVMLNEACSDSLELLLKPIPNAFIPHNADGANDIFMPHVELTIFNRWGQVLYQGQEGWDGTYKGKRVSAGTYFYLITFNNNLNSDFHIKGSVLLIE